MASFFQRPGATRASGSPFFFAVLSSCAVQLLRENYALPSSSFVSLRQQHIDVYVRFRVGVWSRSRECPKFGSENGGAPPAPVTVPLSPYLSVVGGWRQRVSS
ncbi:unnamed protein product [Laminaria digitata]